MSIQICRIKGIGYKFPYEEKLFNFLPNEKNNERGYKEDFQDIEHDFLNVIGLNFSYYEFQKDTPHPINPRLAVIVDGMNGEYKYVLYVQKAEYINNTHLDEEWEKEYRYDDYVKEYAKQKIETFLGRKMDKEPKEFDFKHYS